MTVLTSQTDIQRAQRLVSRLLQRLEDELSQEPPSLFTEFWGEKETPLSVLLKLTQVLVRLMPAREKSSGSEADYLLTEEDCAILERGRSNLRRNNDDE